MTSFLLTMPHIFQTRKDFCCEEVVRRRKNIKYVTEIIKGMYRVNIVSPGGESRYTPGFDLPHSENP